MKQDAGKVPGLVAATDVPRLVLDPHRDVAGAEIELDRADRRDRKVDGDLRASATLAGSVMPCAPANAHHAIRGA